MDNPTKPYDPVIAVFDRKLLLMLFTQLAIAFPAYFKIITPDLAATLGTVLVGVWMLAHAHQLAGTGRASGVSDVFGTLLPSIGQVATVTAATDVKKGELVVLHGEDGSVVRGRTIIHPTDDTPPAA